MRLNRLPLAALLLAGSVSIVPAAHGQSFGIAAGVASESRMNTGGSVQLSYFTKTGLPQLGLRLDALYVQRPNGRLTAIAEDGTFMSSEASPTRTYGIVTGLTYQVGKRAVQPYAVVGAGFYSRDSYTSGFALGANAGIGANARVGPLHLFGEARVHRFDHIFHTPRLIRERVRIVPITFGLRF